MLKNTSMKIPVSLIQGLWPAISDEKMVFTGYRDAIAGSQFCYEFEDDSALGGFPAVQSIPQLQPSVIVSIISKLTQNQHPQFY